MSKMSELRELLKEKISSKSISQTSIVKATGIDQGSLSHFLNDVDYGLSGENALKLATWMEGQIEQVTIQRMGANSPKIVVSEGEKWIDIYHIAGAGPGWEIVEVEPIKSIRVPISFSAQASFAVVVDGDSMSPTLQRGSVVGVRDGAPFHSNEIYAVRPPAGGLSVKRVIRDYQRDGYILRSDNLDKGRYEDIFVPLALAEFLLVGRVVWVWQGV